MAATAPPPAEAPDTGAKRIVVSEDLPLTVLTAVATTLVMRAIGLPQSMLYVGVALSPLVADVIKNAFRGLRKRWLSLLAALLVLLGTTGRALAARLRARPDRKVGAYSMLSTAAVSAVLTVALFTAFEIGSGNATTFFGSHTARHVRPDRTPPRLAVPARIDAYAPGPTVVRFRASARDGIDGPVVTSCAPRSGSVFRIGKTIVACSAADSQHNRATRRFLVTVHRALGNVTLIMPKPAPTDATGPAGARVTYTVSASGASGKNVVAACAPRSGSMFPIGVSTVHCAAAGVSGTFEIRVIDDAPPTLDLPGDQKLKSADAAGRIFTYLATASDRVDGRVRTSCKPGSGSRFAVGTTTVTCVARDAHGNRATGSFVVAVKLSKQPDTTAPVLVLPAPITKEATSSNGATVAYTASATDSVDGSVATSCVPAPGSTFPLGTTHVRCSARDLAGNRSARSFDVVVVDRTAPTIQPLPNLTAEAISSYGALVDFKPAATDIVDGDVTPVCTPAPHSAFRLGVTTVSCTAKDAHGNSSSAHFDVNVVDTTGPTVTVPAGLTVEATSARGAVVRYSVSANDIVSGPAVTTCSPLAGLFPLGQTTVTCSATDTRGNRGTAGFTVNVVDRTGPTLSLPASFMVEAVFGHLYPGELGADVTYPAPTAFDTVDGRVTPTCSIQSGTWIAVATTTLKTIQCNASDSHGNRTTGSFNVTIHVTPLG